MRIERAHQAMLAAQEAANNEDKSSAGDKYETARAMGQADRDMNARQLQEALNERKILEALPPDHVMEFVGPGALIHVEQRFLFIAVGLGSLQVDGRDVVVLSAASPLYAQLRQKRAGESILFQNRQVVIDSVC